MKSILKIALALALSLLTTFSYAQLGDVNKSDLLGVMNNFDGMGLSASDESALKEANSKAVDKIFDIEDKGFDSTVKSDMLRKAKKENDKLFEDILGKDMLKDYKKKLKKELKPYTRKAKMLKFII